MKRFICLFLIILSLSLIHVAYNDSRKEKNFYSDVLVGFIYRAPWNSSYQLVFICDDFKAIVNTSSLTYETLEKARKGALCTIRHTSFRIPESARNKGLFDQKRYYRSRGISYICTPSDKNVSFEGKQSLKYLVHLPGARFRAYVSDILTEKMNYSSGNFTLAVMTGDTGRADSDERELFVRSGLSHLMCVSGMHVIYFMMPFRKASKRKFLDYKKRSLFLLIPLILFVMLSDFSPSVVRAGWSAAGILIAGILRRKNDGISDIFLSASVLLALNPYAVMSAGFILSYLSVLSLKIFYPVFLDYCPFFKNNEGGNTVKIRLINKESLAAGICVNIMLAPVMIYLYGSYSVFGIILTLFTSPLAAIICVSGYICVILSGIPILSLISSILGRFIYFIYKLLLFTASLTDDLPEGIRSIKLSRNYAIILCVIVYSTLLILLIIRNSSVKGVLVKMFSKSPKRIVASAVSALIIVFAAYFIFIHDTNVLEVYAADVGQGLCLIVKSGGRTGLIDTGDGTVSLSEIMEGYSVRKIDFVILTHAHQDHAGGLDELLQKYKSTLIISDVMNDELAEIEAKAIEHGWKVMRAGSGSEMSFGKANAVFVCVGEYFTERSEESENNSSLCVRLSCSYGSLFVSGDIQSEAEKILSERGLIKQSDVLIVPHHGSKFSSTENLLMNIGADYGIISVGRRNSYGHPSEEALERLVNSGYKVIRTDQSGGICVRIGRKTILGKGSVRIWTML